MFDASSKSSDEKRFCTLNLFYPMEVDIEDPWNLPRPHVVFSGKLQTADQWHDQAERELWDPDVAVSFQPNAWVDTPTHTYGLKECLGPINDHLAKVDSNMKGLVFEDNLSTHQTELTMKYWEEELAHFMAPFFLPPNMTDILQVRVYCLSFSPS